MSKIPEDLFPFLEELQQNNRKEWFDSQKKRYEGLKQEVISWLDETLIPMKQADADLPTIEAKQCFFRINRDVRFSADKSPYKTHVGLSVSKGGKKWPGAGYYFHLAPDEVFLAAGVWMPEAQFLKNIRQEIDYCQEEYLNLIAQLLARGYSMMEEGRLSRPPKGFDKDHPALIHLQNKHFVIIEKVERKSALSSSFTKQVVGFTESMASYCRFLNRCLPEELQGS